MTLTKRDENLLNALPYFLMTCFTRICLNGETLIFLKRIVRLLRLISQEYPKIIW